MGIQLTKRCAQITTKLSRFSSGHATLHQLLLLFPRIPPVLLLQSVPTPLRSWQKKSHMNACSTIYKAPTGLASHPLQPLSPPCSKGHPPPSMKRWGLRQLDTTADCSVVSIVVGRRTDKDRLGARRASAHQTSSRAIKHPSPSL